MRDAGGGARSCTVVTLAVLASCETHAQICSSSTNCTACDMCCFDEVAGVCAQCVAELCPAPPPTTPHRCLPAKCNVCSDCCKSFLRTNQLACDSCVEVNCRGATARTHFPGCTEPVEMPATCGTDTAHPQSAIRRTCLEQCWEPWAPCLRRPAPQGPCMSTVHALLLVAILAPYCGRVLGQRLLTRVFSCNREPRLQHNRQGESNGFDSDDPYGESNGMPDWIDGRTYSETIRVTRKTDGHTLAIPWLLQADVCCSYSAQVEGDQDCCMEIRFERSTCTPDGNHEQEVVKNEGRTKKVVGKYKPAEPGKIVFVFDNSFSWFTDKTIKLTVTEDSRPAADVIEIQGVHMSYICREDSSWTNACSRAGLSTHLGVACTIGRLLFWHVLQPLAYIGAFWTVGYQLDSRQYALGWVVGVRELVYLALIAAAAVQNPAVFLLDINACYADSEATGEASATQIMSGGTSFLLMYTCMPAKFVQRAVLSKGGDMRSLAGLLTDIIVIFDLVSCFALICGWFVASVMPFPLAIGYIMTMIAGLMMAFEMVVSFGNRHRAGNYSTPGRIESGVDDGSPYEYSTGYDDEHVSVRPVDSDSCTRVGTLLLGALFLLWFSVGVAIVFDHMVGGVPWIHDTVGMIPWHKFGWTRAPLTAGLAMMASAVLSSVALVWPTTTGSIATFVIELVNLAETIFAVHLQHHSFSAYEVFGVFVLEPWIRQLFEGVVYGSSGQMVFAIGSECVQCYLFMKYCGCFIASSKVAESNGTLNATSRGSVAADLDTKYELAEHDLMSLNYPDLAARIFPAFAVFQIMAIITRWCGETSSMAARESALIRKEFDDRIAAETARLEQRRTQLEREEAEHARYGWPRTIYNVATAPVRFLWNPIGYLVNGDSVAAERRRRFGAEANDMQRQQNGLEKLERARQGQDTVQQEKQAAQQFKVFQSLTGLMFTLMSPESPFRAEWFDQANGCFCFSAGLALGTRFKMKRREREIEALSSMPENTSFHYMEYIIRKQEQPFLEMQAKLHDWIIVPVATSTVLITWCKYLPTLIHANGYPMFDSQMALLTLGLTPPLAIFYYTHLSRRRFIEQNKHTGRRCLEVEAKCLFCCLDFLGMMVALVVVFMIVVADLIWCLSPLSFWESIWLAFLGCSVLLGCLLLRVWCEDQRRTLERSDGQ
eukprot:COSAG02_NODE_887_length_16169_cov_33.169011_6_plen_1168_part_00